MKEIPIWEKHNLTLEEAAAYYNIGVGKLRELTNESLARQAKAMHEIQRLMGIYQLKYTTNH